jgi:hypothetical protein
MDHELQKLLKTVNGEAKLDYWRKEFENFKHIFARYLQTREIIDWAKIEPLPDGSIIPYDHVRSRP